MYIHCFFVSCYSIIQVVRTRSKWIRKIKMDDTHNVDLDGGGEGVKTSAGLNSANSAGPVDSGVLTRAEEIPVANVPQLSVTRLDQDTNETTIS